MANCRTNTGNTPHNETQQRSNQFPAQRDAEQVHTQRISPPLAPQSQNTTNLAATTPIPVVASPHPTTSLDQANEVPCTFEDNGRPITTVSVPFLGIPPNWRTLCRLITKEFKQKIGQLQVEVVFGTDDEPKKEHELYSPELINFYFNRYIWRNLQHNPHLHVAGNLEFSSEAYLSSLVQTSRNTSQVSHLPCGSSTPSSLPLSASTLPQPSTFFHTTNRPLDPTVDSNFPTEPEEDDDAEIFCDKYNYKFLQENYPTALTAVKSWFDSQPPDFLALEQQRAEQQFVAQTEDDAVSQALMDAIEALTIPSPDVKDFQAFELVIKAIVDLSQRVYGTMRLDLGAFPQHANGLVEKLLDNITFQHLQRQQTEKRSKQQHVLLWKSLETVTRLSVFLYAPTSSSTLMKTAQSFIKDTLYELLTPELVPVVRGVSDVFMEQFAFRFKWLIRNKMICTYETLGSAEDVYKGYSLDVGAALAIKICTDIDYSALGETDHLEELEAAIARLQSQELPNKPQVIELVHHCPRTNSEYVFATKLHKETTLREFMQSGKGCSEQMFIDLAQQIFVMLHSLWQHRIHHCDLQPKRIMMFADNMKLTDIGYPKFLCDEDKLSSSGNNIHKSKEQKYLAPEVVDGSLKLLDTADTNKADLYSAAVVITELSTVVRKNDGMNAQTGGRITQLRDLVHRMWERDPTQRITYIDAWDHPFLQPLCLPLARVNNVH